jgi:TolB protein
MMHRFLGLVLGLFVAGMLLASPASAEIKVDITRGHSEPLPIAIMDFTGKTAGDTKFGKDISGVIRANLERSGLFRIVDQNAYIQKDVTVTAQPRFADWRVIGAKALVVGAVEQQSDGRLRLEFRLWDVAAEEQLSGLAYFGLPQNWRRIAHITSDEVYKRLTGEDGYFDSRIVYVAESGIATNRIKRLAVMDQDGANHRYLTDGRNLALTPRFSTSVQEVVYLSYSKNKPRVHLLNIDTGQEEVLGDFPGMTFAPRFSPNGNSVIMSMSTDGNSEIYNMDLRSRSIKRLTYNPSIDTSPSFSPDGRQIVFNSDRGGSQQLYTMNADGSNVQRISFGSGRYGTPVWSPRGDLVAFTKMEGGTFYIGVMRPDGKGERLLTKSWLDEGPTWSPNGRVLIFSRQTPSNSRGQGGSSKLVSVDLTGENERTVTTPQEASDPAWSPRIP